MALVPGRATGSQPPGDLVEFGRPSRQRPRLSSLLLTCLVAAAVVVVVSTRSGAHRTPPLPPPRPVAVTLVGHPILGIRASWELFGLDRGGMVRVQFSRGQITRTTVPPLLSGGPVFFIAADGEAIIRPLDNVPGYVVPDGKPARQLTGLLAQGGILLPGPTLTEQWFGRTSLELLGPGGKRVNARLAAVARVWAPFWVISDGAGGVVLVDMRSQVEEYDARPGMLRPVSAQLVAVGPTTWLGMNCESGPCQDVVISAATGASTALPGPPVSLTPWSSPLGAVAPDGLTAAVIVPGGSDVSTLELVSLSTGSRTRVAVTVSGPSSSRLAWSPDSRWLFVVTGNGRLDAVDSHTGRAQGLGLGVSGLTQIVIRPAAG
ncbi:MAG TPA: hypothetical protein VEV45_16770 [Streptosporangiaceae bacterium]|nr:hypothetical protein [Streptosporangiaceae bacterium]